MKSLEVRENDDINADACLYDLIEKSVAKFGANTAIIFNSQSITYFELNAKANQWALYFREIGLSSEQPVIVMMEPSIDRVIVLLAILKAGGAYLPLDVNDPIQKIHNVQIESGAPFILSQSKYKKKLSFLNKRIIDIGSEFNQVKAYPHDTIITSAGPKQLAYIIYTAGPAGNPVGCMISHEAICNRLLWMRDHYDVNENDRLLQIAPFISDVSIWELFLPLVSGATLVLNKAGRHQDIQYIIDIINEKKITICHFFPFMLKQFVNSPFNFSCKNLRKVFVSGENLSYKLMEQFLDTMSPELHNLYGPTETAADVTNWLCNKNHYNKVLIGKPIRNVKVYILNDSKQLAPVGEEGEMYIGGVQLAMGYLNNPDLNNEKFIDAFVSSDEKVKLFKTGDKARLLEDGNIELLGRVDSQVKIRGLRIEPREIETALLSLGEINDAIVLLHNHENIYSGLLAYVVMANNSETKINQLRSRLRDKLPMYMLPDAIINLDKIPLTSHGDVDKAALPGLQTGGQLKKSMYGASYDEIFSNVSDYFVDALGLFRIDPDQNLFDLGITSSIIKQFSKEVYQQYQISVPVEIYFDAPTVNGITASILWQLKVDCFELKLHKQPLPAYTETVILPYADCSVPVVSQGEKLPELANKRFSLLEVSRWLGLLKQNIMNHTKMYFCSSSDEENTVQAYLYVKKNAIEGVSAGMYCYHPINHTLDHVFSLEKIDNSIVHPLCRDHFNHGLLCLFLISRDLENDIVGVNGKGAGFMLQKLMRLKACCHTGVIPVSGVDFDRIKSNLKLERNHKLIACLTMENVKQQVGSTSHKTEISAAEFL